MEKSFICIGCPMGCLLNVTGSAAGQAEALTVTGNQCKIGEQYAREEVVSPMRNITTSVPVANARMPRLSVKTSRPVPKDAIMACMNAIKAVTASAPVAIGDIILPDAAGTGADFVATRNVAQSPNP